MVKLIYNIIYLYIEYALEHKNHIYDKLEFKKLLK